MTGSRRHGFNPAHPLPSPRESRSYDAYRWERDLLLGEARRAAAGSPEAARAWLLLGVFCAERAGENDDPEQAPYDRELARAALERGLAGGGPAELRPSARLRLAELLIGADDGPPALRAVDRAGTLAAAVAGLPPGTGDDEAVRYARLLVADIAALRWSLTGAVADRERAVARYTAVLDGRPAPEAGPRAAAHAALGRMFHERASADGDASGLASAARHFASALAAGGDPADVPVLAGDRGFALFELGELTADAGSLREAEAAFTLSGEAARGRQVSHSADSASGCVPDSAADAESRSGSGSASGSGSGAGSASASASGSDCCEEGVFWADFARRAEALAVCAAVQAWRTEGSPAPPAALISRVRHIAASPGHTDTAVPNVPTALACFLLDLPAAASDPAERERALRLLEAAAGRWEPEHGPPHYPHLKLAVHCLDLARHRPAELPVSARAAAAVLERTSEPNPVLSALLIRAVARAQLLDGGGNTADPDAARFRAAVAAGAGTPVPISADPERWTATVDRLVGPTESMEELFPRWQRGAGRDRDHAAHAVFILRNSPLLDPGRTLTPDRLQALLSASVPGGGTPDPIANTASSIARSHYGGLLTGPSLRLAAEAAEAAATGHRAADPAAADADVMAGMAAILKILGGPVNGGRDDLAEGLGALRDLVGRMENMTDAERAGLPDLGLLQGVLPSLMVFLSGGSAGEKARALAALRPEDLGLDPGHPAWAALRPAMGRTAAPPGEEDAAAPELIRSTAGMPALQRAALLAALGAARTTRAHGRGDRHALRDAAALLGAARDAAVRGDDTWLTAGMLLGFLGCEDAMLGRSWSRRARLREAIGILEETHRETRGPEHPLRARSGFTLAKSLRLRDDRAAADRTASRRIAAEALRATAYGVLLQSGTADAASVATEATATALTVARWCLADGEPAEAVGTLDACRGLVLHAATTARTVDRRLAEAGHGALAARWARALADGAPPASALRREVLDVLLTLDGGAADRLLSPPGVPQIAAALRAVGRDALVYLLPAAPAAGSTGEAAGAAVVVAADGGTGVVPLPLLREDAEPLRQYLERPESGRVRSARAPAGAFDPVAAFDALGATAGGRTGHGPRRAMGPAHGAVTRVRTLSQRLDRLCAWAWQALTEPLLDALRQDDMPVVKAGRTPRLVLVPMGDLSVVPWHAAWSAPAGGGRRYALDSAEFTYAASARLLCEVAGRPARPPTDAALIVGDPTGDLPFAGREAAAIREAHYPRAVFLGRAKADGLPAVDGDGRPEEVLAWLRSGAGRGGTLHLACHASVVENVRHSAALRLREGDLSAEELTEALDGGTDAGHPDLVVLAACRSHVSGRGTNEAYTLATAFLTAGARSVLGSLWPVPDEATSLLMFMTHHYLRAEGREPAEALRLAQRWMADPGRSLPPYAPEGMARLMPRIVPHDLSAWAGFIATGR